MNGAIKIFQIDQTGNRQIT